MVESQHMLSTGDLAALSFAALALSCSEPRGACVRTLDPPLRDISQTCRDDGTQSTCVVEDPNKPTPVFTRGRTCPQIGFSCLGNSIDAAYRHTNPDGSCPPDSSR